MGDLAKLFNAQDRVARWRAEVENAQARLQLERQSEALAFLISQYEPVHSIGMDREALRVLLSFVRHGDIPRLMREIGKFKREVTSHDSAGF